MSRTLGKYIYFKVNGMSTILRHVSKRVEGGQKEREEDTEMQALTTSSLPPVHLQGELEGTELNPGEEEGTSERQRLVNNTTKNDEKTQDLVDEPSRVQTCKSLASLFVCLSTTVVSYTSVQMLQRGIPDFELNAMRYTTVSLFLLMFLIYQRKSPSIPKEELLSTFMFGIFALLDSICIYTAVTFIPLSSADAIRLTSGVLSGIILFYRVLKEKVKISQIIFSIVCICGVVCVTQPGFIFWKLTYVESKGQNNTTSAPLSGDHSSSIATVAMGYCLSAVSGVSISCYIMAYKRRSYISENVSMVLFWSCLLCAGVSVVAMTFVERPTLPGNLKDIILVSVHSISFVFNWPTFILGFKYLSGNTVNIICCCTVVLMLIPQYTISSSIYPGHRNWVEVVGVTLVLLGAGFESSIEVLKQKLT